MEWHGMKWNASLGMDHISPLGPQQSCLMAIGITMGRIFQCVIACHLSSPHESTGLAGASSQLLRGRVLCRQRRGH
eukprot:scaffold403505_cov17-Prasinocladus_malaysianus.AAC.2